MTRKTCISIILSFVFLCISGPVLRSDSKDRALGLRTVVIDAGHGGKDPGGVSRDKKTYEKNLVLDISKRFGQKIRERHPDVKVVYTRSSDVYITLNERAAIANRNNADLFISIHTNANNSSSVHGASVHILGQSRDPKRDLYAGKMDVSRRENSVILLEDDYSTDYQGFDPDSPESFIFFNLMQNAYYEQSILFASEVDQALRKTDFAVSSYTGIHQDPFWLLWKTAMPAVLLELGFISNPDDLKVLTSAEGRNDIAQKLLEAFSSFKASYDASIEARQETVQEPVREPVQETVSEAVKTGGRYFGIQIMGLGRLLENGDPALKGLKVKALKTQDSKVYKYVTGEYQDKADAQKHLSDVRRHFPEAFVVEVEGDRVTRIR